MVTSANNIAPKEIRRRRKNEWMTEEILHMMQRRQKITPRHGAEYKKLHREIRNKCRLAKDAQK